MKPPDYVPLKQEVERIFGKKIVSYSDCLTLSKEITLRTGFRLNVNTLRRFFGLVQASYPPSQTTVDILSRLCGFKSYESFSAFQVAQPAEDEAQGSPLLHYLEVLFGKATLTTYTDPTWYGIVRETILYMEKHPHLLDAFQRNMARTKLGQEIYFEQFVNIDQLNGYYGNGLRYYITEKNTREGKLFVHSLLSLRYYLTQEGDALEKQYHELMLNTIDERIHPFLGARYFAAQLYFHARHPTEIYSILSAARAYFKSMMPAKDLYQPFPCFELLMVEALVLTRQPLEALFYIQEAKKKRSDYYPPGVDKYLFSAFDLYETAAFSILGEGEKAKKVFRRVNPMEFYFLSRRFHNLLFLTVRAILFPAREKGSRVQIRDLVERTGFKRMEDIFKEEDLVDKKEQHNDFLL